MKWRTVRITTAMLAALGAWQLSSGLYIHAKAWLAQQLIASAWSRTLAGANEVRPWPWADTWPVARLRVRETGVDIYVLADASGRSLAFGPGHVSGTAPLASDGNSMIAGHRDTHFSFLRHLDRGATISIQTSDGRESFYRVTELHVIDMRSERLEIEGGAPTLTLLTCYPFDALVPGGPLRYAATAQQVQPPERKHVPPT